MLKESNLMKKIFIMIKSKFEVFCIIQNFKFDKNDQHKRNNRKVVAQDAISKWYKILKKDELKYFVKVLKEYRYYSQTTVGKTFEMLVEDKKYEEVKKVIDENSAIFMPLKKHNDRTETSIAMFTTFMNVLAIDSMQTAQEDTVTWFKNYKTFETQYYEKEDKLELELENFKKTEQKIFDLEESKKGKEQAIIKSIDRQIVKLSKSSETSLSEAKKSFEKIKNDHGHEIKAKNIFIIDDFLCSGTSVNNFAKKVEPYIKDIKKTIYFIFLEATKEGKDMVESSDLFKDFSHLKICNIYISEDFEKNVLKSESERKRFQQIKMKLYKEYNLKDNSHYKPHTAMSSFVNAPNSNFAFLSLKKKESKWFFPFPRNKRSR